MTLSGQHLADVNECKGGNDGVRYEAYAGMAKTMMTCNDTIRCGGMAMQKIRTLEGGQILLLFCNMNVVLVNDSQGHFTRYFIVDSLTCTSFQTSTLISNGTSESESLVVVFCLLPFRSWGSPRCASVVSSLYFTHFVLLFITTITTTKANQRRSKHSHFTLTFHPCSKYHSSPPATSLFLPSLSLN